MKKLFILFIILLCIVVAAAWFVNRHYEFISISSLSNTGSDIIDTIQTQSADSWQFAVIGDTEDLPAISRTMVEDLATRDLAFVIHVGDMSYKGGVDGMRKTKELFDTLPFPTYYIPGNNDLVYDEATERKTLESYKKVFGDKTYQSFDYNNAHFVLLDNSYLRIGFSDEELGWLEHDLDNNDADHTFLFYHRPLDVPGQQWFGDDETPNSRAQNEKFKKLISDYTITRIYNGHLHFSLTYTMDGIPVTITGGGGAAPQPILGGDSVAYYHYQLVTVYESEDGSIEPTQDIISFK